MPDNNLFDQDHPDVPAQPEHRGAPGALALPGSTETMAAPTERAGFGEPRTAYGDPGGESLSGAEYVRVTRPAGPLRKILLTLGAAVIIIGLLAGSLGLWVQRQINPSGEPGTAVTMVIPSGSTSDDIATLLAEEGIVSNSTVFRYYLRWRGTDAFQAGEYVLVQNSSFDDVIETLAAGPAPPRFERFTVPEGLTIAEIGERLDGVVDQFDVAEMPSALIRMRSEWRPPQETSWEGLLFPDTYEYRATDDTLAVLERMKNQFDVVARDVGLSPDMDPSLHPSGLSPYEYIIIASMIEREARLSEEHVLMSRVIHNRLALGMTLGIDATVIYARGPERTGPITDADLAIDSPYNTRLNPGLPPTPIAAVSRSALQAALNPADGPWLYYVLAEADGSHFFTDDFDEFIRVRNESRARGLF